MKGGVKFGYVSTFFPCSTDMMIFLEYLHRLMVRYLELLDSSRSHPCKLAPHLPHTYPKLRDLKSLSLIRFAKAKLYLLFWYVHLWCILYIIVVVKSIQLITILNIK